MNEKKRIDKPYPPYVATSLELAQRLHRIRPRRADQSSADADPDVGPPPNVEPKVTLSPEAHNQQRTGQKSIAESGKP